METERWPHSFIPPEDVEALGEESLGTYEHMAKESNVPANFVSISQTITLDFFPEISSRTRALFLFGQDFASEDESWIAIRYAEAISAIKASEEYEIWPSVEHLVGLSVLLEQGRGDEVEHIRQKVEDCFEDPVSIFHCLNLQEIVENGEYTA